ncbi:hypothetical protein FOZ60_006927 [Perkinsus olseni]|uniref:Uncharacterized protein n=1 Tax=Perkinsus olseni TaxID=32597 RepID=A0A7J6PFJ8_PEROL|nr:hypothetical protein FOZ60_006927 [Perkinsus olseni]
MIHHTLCHDTAHAQASSDLLGGAFAAIPEKALQSSFCQGNEGIIRCSAAGRRWRRALLSQAWPGEP